MMKDAIPYNPVFDAQRHFRVLLDCMARPGKIRDLADISMVLPIGISLPAALIGFALLNEDTTFWMHPSLAEASSFLQRHTGSRPTSLEKADFLFGSAGMETEWVRKASVGLAEYPETGATLIVEADQVSTEPLSETIALSLEGPGIDQEKQLHVSGIDTSFWQALREKNENYPLGVDAILVTPTGSISCLPRSTKLYWEK